MPRRTPTERANYHAEQAQKHRTLAKMQEDPVFRAAVRLRDIIGNSADDEESALRDALNAYIEAVKP